MFLLNSCVLWFEIEIVCPVLKYFIIFPQSYLPCWKLQIGWDSVMIMSADKRDLFLYEAFLYFNPLLLAVSSPPPLTQHTVSVCHSVWLHGVTHLHIHLLYHVSYLFVMFQTLMVWLWGINLWFFAQGGVNYPKIFDLDQNHLTHREIWKVSTHHFDLSCLAHKISILSDSRRILVVSWLAGNNSIALSLFEYLVCSRMFLYVILVHSVFKFSTWNKHWVES